MKVAFSALYNETEYFLSAYIANFLNFTRDEAFLFINIGHDSKIDLSRFDDLPHRIKIARSLWPRQKIGPGLLCGHLENVALASASGVDFAYFCTTASNALFIRDFSVAEAISALNNAAPLPAHALDRMPVDGWQYWPMVFSNQPFLGLLQECGLNEVANRQIEGLFMSMENWQRVAELLPRLRDRLSDCEHLFPYEEVLPQTVLQASGDGRAVNLCDVLWVRSFSNRHHVTTRDLLLATRASRPLAKWFIRDLKDPVTKMVTDPTSIGLLRGLRSILAISDHQGRFRAWATFEEVSRIIAEESGFFFSDPTAFVPFLTHRQPFRQRIAAKVQVVSLLPESTVEASRVKAYIVPTESDGSFDIDIEVIPGEYGNEAVRIRCTSADANAGSLRHGGFLYLGTELQSVDLFRFEVIARGYRAPFAHVAPDLVRRAADAVSVIPWQTLPRGGLGYAIDRGVRPIAGDDPFATDHIGLPLIVGGDYVVVFSALVRGGRRPNVEPPPACTRGLFPQHS